QGAKINNEMLKRGVRCSYLLNFHFTLQDLVPVCWSIVTDVAQTQDHLAILSQQLEHPAPLAVAINEAIEHDGEELRKLMSSSDAIQHTAEQTTCVHHYANVLFNNLRGGAIANNYQISSRDYLQSLTILNKGIYHAHQAFFDGLPAEISYQELLRDVEAQQAPQLMRLTLEYLPVTFGRRHGDPSRPWNHFEIRVKDNDGSRLLNYQGNWRDIFQNWEALSLSFPEFIPSFIAKFVSASTIDGYNPYRITKQGIDWEVVEPDNPWSNIGYWGDHQIIYLLKFLEWSKAYQPAMLQQQLRKAVYAYAQVPYEIKPYQQILLDAKDTVIFDHDLAAKISQRVAEIGNDGKLITDSRGEVYLCTLMEKLLVPFLSKLGNFVAEGGIWLNTQRPEWNDANNAIVGNGLSMVTLYYMNRYAQFIQDMLANEQDALTLSREVADWLRNTVNTFEQFNPNQMDDGARKQLLDMLGQVACNYRQQVYQHGFSGTVTIEAETLRHFIAVTRRWLAQSIQVNLREDGMYEAYNIGIHHDGQLEVEALCAMLEGQVAVLSSGALDAASALKLIETLYDSAIYRADQDSFTLYPDRVLPGFMQKNCVTSQLVASSHWLTLMLQQGDRRIISCDAAGQHRFHADFANGKQLAATLNSILNDYPMLTQPQAEIQRILAIYETIFNHKAFTGRSGTMFAYEGLGSIYWHMVSKLLLAVQEVYLKARDSGCDRKVIDQLGHYYYRVRAGIGFNKTPENYGAFPCDPYSHTPGHAGARQPGMTGQVKEEIIARWGELGLMVKDGQLFINPSLLRAQEFIPTPSEFHYYDLAGNPATINQPADSLAFTWCGVPFVYCLTDATEPALTVHYDDGKMVSSSLALSAACSQALFDRTGEIQHIVVTVSRDSLFSY
ncbi:MAG: hypothetical protein ACRC9V_08080, partial [Aeromonas sp.]